jgi:glycosyltransferase involved in cell wall biosynthesis
MKILIVTDDFFPNISGGAGLITYFQAKELSEANNIVKVFTVNQAKHSYNLDKINVYSCTFKYPAILRRLISLFNPYLTFKLITCIKNFNPDIIHFHNVHLYISFYAIKISSKYCNKIFLTCHDMMTVANGKVRENDLVQKEDLIFKEIKKCLQCCSVIAVSKSLAKGLTLNKIHVEHVLHNCLPSDLNLEDSYNLKLEIFKFKQRYGISQLNNLFLFCGRVSYLKGIDFAIKAIQKTNGHLLVVGVNRENTSHVTFVDWVTYEEMKYFYMVSLAVLVPSIYLDPFPTVNLEAFKYGKPVIGSIYGGTSEIVDNGINGFLINPANVEEFSDRIRYLINNPTIAQKMGKSAYEKFITKYNIRSCINQLINLYEIK